MKKTIFCTAILSCLTPFTFYADQTQENLDSALFESDTIENTPAIEPLTPASQMISATSAPSTTQSMLVITPTPSEKAHRHWYVRGDLLAWKPYYSNLPYVTKEIVLQNVTHDEQLKCKSLMVQMDWSVGARASIGFSPTWKGLGLDLTWTHFFGDAKQHKSYPNPGELMGTSLVPYWYPSATSAGSGFYASASSRICYDVIDFTIAKGFMATKSFELIPFVGVRQLFSEQTLKTSVLYNYKSFPAGYTTTPPYNTYTIFLKQEFNATGLIGGIGASLELGWNWTFNTMLDVALVYGNLKNKNTTVANLVGYTPTYTYLSANKHTFKPIVDFSAGFAKYFNFCKDKCRLGFHGEYEFHYLPDFNQYIKQNISNVVRSYRTNLMFNGVNIGASFEF